MTRVHGWGRSVSTADKALTMAPSLVIPGVLNLLGASPYWVGMTMFRVQEYYEGKDELRGKVFSFETAMDVMAKPTGAFTYAEDYQGFNVPGHILDEFFIRYRGMLTAKESRLQQLIAENRTSTVYYLIGVSVQNEYSGYVDHELAHAAYYLDSDYKAIMDGFTRALPEETRQRAYTVLRKDRYADHVHWDEIQAYFATGSVAENADFGVTKKQIEPYRKFLKEYLKKRVSLT